MLNHKDTTTQRGTNYRETQSRPDPCLCGESGAGLRNGRQTQEKGVPLDYATSRGHHAPSEDTVQDDTPVKGSAPGTRASFGLSPCGNGGGSRHERPSPNADSYSAMFSHFSGDDPPNDSASGSLAKHLKSTPRWGGSQHAAAFHHEGPPPLLPGFAPSCGNSLRLVPETGLAAKRRKKPEELLASPVPALRLGAFALPSRESRNRSYET